VEQLVLKWLIIISINYYMHCVDVRDMLFSKHMLIVIGEARRFRGGVRVGFGVAVVE